MQEIRITSSSTRNSGHVRKRLGQLKRPGKKRDSSDNSSRPKTNSSGIWQRIILGPVFGLVLLSLPIFFLPATQDPISLNKLMLLVVFAGIAAVAWLSSSLAQGSIRWRPSLAHIGVGGFLFVSIVASIFSSIGFGFQLNLTSAAFSLVAVVVSTVIYWLIVSQPKYFTSKSENLFGLSGFMLLIAIGIGIAALIGFLQLREIFLLPWPFAQSILFNTIGTSNSLGVIVALGFVISFVQSIISDSEGGVQSAFARWSYRVIAVLSFVLLLGINFRPLWIAIAASALLIIAIRVTIKGVSEISYIASPFALLILSLFFSIAPLSLSFLSTPLEVNPSTSATIAVQKSVLSESPIFGSGLSTFPLQWEANRSESLNVSQFWSVRFAQGSTFFLTLLSEIGYFGIIFWIAMIGLGLWQGMGVISKITKKPDSSVTYAPFVGFVFLVVVSFIYQMSITSMVLLYVLMGLSVVAVRGSAIQVLDFSKPPFKTLTLSLSIMTSMVIILFGLYFSAQYYLGKVYFAKAFNDSELQGAITTLERSVRLHPQDTSALRTLSQAYLLRANETLAANPEGGLSQEVVSLADASIKAAKVATDIAPYDSLNWSNLASVYEALIVAVDGSGELAIEAYEVAQETDPHDPSLTLGIARVNVSLANRVQNIINQENQLQADGYQDRIEDLRNQRTLLLEDAKDTLDIAIGQKSNYESAYFLLAQVQSSLGQSDEAIVAVSNWVSLNQGDAGRWFQLGLLYYQNQNNSQAEQAFTRAVGILDSYSNALYFLGLIQAEDGRTEQALAQFEAIAELNPGNSEVLSIIANIESGLDPLAGISSEPAQRERAPLEASNVTESLELDASPLEDIPEEEIESEAEIVEEVTAQ